MKIIDQLKNSEQNSSQFIQGVAIAIVTNNQDPENLGRVKLKYPWLSDNNESDWVRIATIMAGSSRGAYFLPEIDDEVLVSFEHGDINSPFIVGALWNGKDKPPQNNQEGKNNIRQFKSRSGHTITFDDNKEQKSEKIEINSALGHQIILDDKNQKGNIKIKSKENQSILIDDTNRSIEIKDNAGNQIKIDANSNNITIQAMGGIVIQGQSGITLSSSNIKLGENSNMGLATEKILELFNSHTHTGNKGAPTSPPMQPGIKFVHTTKIIKGA